MWFEGCSAGEGVLCGGSCAGRGGDDVPEDKKWRVPARVELGRGGARGLNKLGGGGVREEGVVCAATRSGGVELSIGGARGLNACGSDFHRRAGLEGRKGPRETTTGKELVTG